ncbi:MAG: hypothetical protein K0Q55_1142 [Verrucomicrobia bacterium]|jgi:hypothetical protein|nr:hypothetical protein [Verrucomicrobiota bacterium]
MWHFRPHLTLATFLMSVTFIASAQTKETSTVPTNSFFQTPPKAERAILSAYRTSEYQGQVSIVIETEPLTFLDPEAKQQLEPEIHLEHVALPSIDPVKLANKRFKPGSDYEGSFYFLAEHNLVDLKEIRFLNASTNSIEAEYDLVIHLPKSEPNKYPITLKARTEIKSHTPQLASPRSVEGLGELVQEKEDFWKGKATYATHPVEIEFHAEPAMFDEIVTFARATLSGHTLTHTILNREISEELKSMEWKLQQFNAPLDLKAEEFTPLRLYFSKRRHQPIPQIIIGLSHPKVAGHWSITFQKPESGSMNWTPKS